MNSCLASPALDVTARVTEVVEEAFSTMLRHKASPVPEPELLPDVERVSGAIGFAGEFVTGAIYIHLPEPLARQAAGAMLGLAKTAPQDGPAVNDVVGEIANMVAGGLKSALSDTGMECGMSTPSIIRGRHFAIEIGPDIARTELHFACGERIFSVDVHLKLNCY